MKHLNPSLALTGLLIGAASPLLAQSEPAPAVPALVAGVNVQIVLTTTGDESTHGPENKKKHSASFEITRMNTKDFVELLDEKYDLVAQPKDFALIAVLVESETENGYRFYLRNKKKHGTPAYIYLAPEVIGLTVDASAMSYTEVQNGDLLLSGKGRYKHAVTVDSAGFETQGVSKGGYTVKNVTVDDVTEQFNVPSAMQISTTGHYIEHEGTPDARTYIAETRWVFAAHKAVDLNDYPAPPVPEIETP